MVGALSIFPEKRYQKRIYRLVYCCREGCEAELLIEASRPISLQQIVATATKAGWKCDSHGYSLCPKHKDDQQRNLTPQQKRAAYLRKREEEEAERLLARQREKDFINKRDEPKSWRRQRRRKVMDTTVETRKPTIPQNRMIQDKLDTYYDVERQKYKGAWNDQLIADQLKMPRIWISTVRSAFYGPEVNDQASVLESELENYIKQCNDQAERCLNFAEKFENLAKVGLDLQARILSSTPNRRTVSVEPLQSELPARTEYPKKRHRMSDLEQEEMAAAVRAVVLGRGQPMQMVDIHKKLKEQNFRFFAINEAAEKQCVRRAVRMNNYKQFGSGKAIRYWPADVELKK